MVKMEWIKIGFNKLIALPAIIRHKNVYGEERFMPAYQPFVSWKKAHFERYNFAADLLKPTDTVLDLACGVGYGTSILAKKSSNAVGVDISKESIKYAKKKYQSKNNNFIQGDLFGSPELTGFDVVVSFETIEHVDRPMYEILNSLVTRATRLFIGSVPYKEKPGNIYHCKFNLVESDFAFLQQYGRVTFYFQEKEPGFKILDTLKEGEEPQNIIFKVELNS